MRLSQVLDELARDLNDAEEGHPFQTWTRGQLLAYINEAQCNAFVLNSALFVRTVIMQLAPGREQQPCECSILQQIIGQTDAAGNLLDGYLPRRSDAATYSWTKPGCPAPSGPFRLTGYNFDPLQGGAFAVTPPVPPNVKVYVKARCAVMPETLATSNLDDDCCGPGNGSDSDCRIITAAKQWVLFRALMVEEQSVSSVQTAMIHLKLYFALLNVQFSRQLAQQIGALSSPAAVAAIQTARVAL
ncbi:DUF6682 family protein [Paraburkholderia dinghuensis]|uniref:Uncharacterized protein n=1 Tax=Paraburkholderia dinghuensis TaxID=2305225 RepID=A0A3N6Q2U7_9BURK|nr:DUF6682 family protein [Paraburkholderia dinghuensis]RQH06626.1 hypothetical protein D1Y85_12195 [Paraburkholderia dinghuensis]